MRSCVEGVVAFGVERDTLARFIAAANETEIASREREALDEAMEALRRKARRWETRSCKTLETYTWFEDTHACVGGRVAGGSSFRINHFLFAFSYFYGTVILYRELCLPLIPAPRVGIIDEWR